MVGEEGWLPSQLPYLYIFNKKSCFPLGLHICTKDYRCVREIMSSALIPLAVKKVIQWAAKAMQVLIKIHRHRASRLARMSKLRDAVKDDARNLKSDPRYESCCVARGGPKDPLIIREHLPREFLKRCFSSWLSRFV